MARALTYATVRYEVAGGGVATIAMDQPDTRNALSDELLGDLIAASFDSDPAEVVVGTLLAEAVASVLDELTVRERTVIRLRFGLEDDVPRTLQEIGDRLHLSRERVRQIESRAKEKLRRSAKLRSHLN